MTDPAQCQALPEELLYDGNEPEARIVGLSYLIVHGGGSKPT